MVLYALFEHAAGYAVFKVNSTEDIGALLPEVQVAVTDLERFGRIVKLVAFSPFKTAANALENINSISEGKIVLKICLSPDFHRHVCIVTYWWVYLYAGVVHDDLKVFLESNVPTGKKKSKVALGISDPKIGAGIQESCNIQCESGPTVLEVLRGIRFHFHKLIQGNALYPYILKTFYSYWLCYYFTLIFHYVYPRSYCWNVWESTIGFRAQLFKSKS